MKTVLKMKCCPGFEGFRITRACLDFTKNIYAKNNYLLPKTYLNYKPDSILPLNKYLSFMTPLRISNVSIRYDYVLIIQWDRSLGRQTRRFIDAVKKNISKAPHQCNLRIIWCYNENASSSFYVK